MIITAAKVCGESGVSGGQKGEEGRRWGDKNNACLKSFFVAGKLRSPTNRITLLHEKEKKNINSVKGEIVIFDPAIAKA